MGLKITLDDHIRIVNASLNMKSKIPVSHWSPINPAEQTQL